MSGTSVGAVIAALDSVYTAAAPAGWTVRARRPFDAKRKFLAVAWTGDQGTPPVQVLRRSPTGAGGTQFEERVSVVSILSLWAGDEVTAAVEAEAFAAYDTFDAALAADPGLGDVAMFASVESYDYYPIKVAEGVCAHVRFTVTAQTWK